MKKFFGIVLAFICGVAVGISYHHSRPVVQAAIADEKSSEATALSDLKAEIELIKGRLPDQAHAMQDVGYHFSNVWCAAQKQHWDLAEFYLSETKSHLRWAVRIIPKRKDKAGQEINLEAILQATENGPLAQVQEAIAAKDDERFVKAYKFTLETCYACHKTVDKPFIRPQIPSGPETQIVNFDPQAEWPK